MGTPAERHKCTHAPTSSSSSARFQNITSEGLKAASSIKKILEKGFAFCWIMGALFHLTHLEESKWGKDRQSSLEGVGIHNDLPLFLDTAINKLKVCLVWKRLQIIQLGSPNYSNESLRPKPIDNT